MAHHRPLIALTVLAGLATASVVAPAQAVTASDPANPRPLTSIMVSGSTPSSPPARTSGYTATRPTPAPYQYWTAEPYEYGKTTDILPSKSEKLPSLYDPAYPLDKNGVLQVKWPGFSKPVYHPVSIEWYALSMLEASLASEDPTYQKTARNRAVANADYLISNAMRTKNGELWFGYPFDYEVHQDKDLTIKAPWYSGMAQGLALSLTSRLYKATGDVKWKNEALAITKTYRVGITKDKPWFAHVDSEGHLWYELYPAYKTPLNVINGHVYAAWGLMDYLTLVNSKDKELARQFDAAITTVSDTFDQFRVPGKASLYCLAQYCRDQKWQDGNYHRGVAYQFALTALMTGDKTFTTRSKLLLADHFW